MKFTLNETNQKELINIIKSLPKNKLHSVEIVDYQEKVSPEQNKFYRKMIRAWTFYPPLRKKMKAQGQYMPNAEEWHEYFKDKYLTEVKPFGKTTVKIQRSSKDLTVKQMGDFIDSVKIFMYETIGFEFGEKDEE